MIDSEQRRFLPFALSWGELYDATQKHVSSRVSFPDWHKQQLEFPKRVDCKLVEVDVALLEREEVPPAFVGKFLPWIRTLI